LCHCHQIVLLLLMLSVLIYGLKLRSVIIRYLLAPDSKSPINTLVWADQV
jgi:hypothetical protein